MSYSWLVIDDDTSNGRFSVGELADRVGISRRAVRYYVQEGLLPGPIGLGRGAFYTDEHVTLLERLRDLQAQGLGLAAVRQHLAAPPADTNPDPERDTERDTERDRRLALETWSRLVIADGVELHLRRDHARIDPAILERIADAIRAYAEPDRAPSATTPRSTR